MFGSVLGISIARSELLRNGNRRISDSLHALQGWGEDKYINYREVVNVFIRRQDSSSRAVYTARKTRSCDCFGSGIRHIQADLLQLEEPATWLRGSSIDEAVNDSPEDLIERSWGVRLKRWDATSDACNSNRTC